MTEKYLVHIRNVLVTLLVIVFLAVLKVTGSVSINLVLALLIFFFIIPLVSFLERKHVPQTLVSFIAIMMVIVVFATASWFIAYVAELLVTNLPAYADKMDKFDAMLMSFLGRWINVPEESTISSFFNIDWVGVVMPMLRSISGTAFDVLKNSLIMIIFVSFLIIERHTIVPKIELAVAKDNQQQAVSILDKCNRQVSKYLGIKFLISLLTGILFYVVAKIAKLDFASIWGVLAVIMNFIPTFGSIIITALIILMAMVQYLPMWTPIIFVSVFSVAIQFVLGNIVEPRIQGNQLNLSPFVIIVAVSVFGYIWGFVGMFLAVPLLSIIVIVMSNFKATRGIAVMLSSPESLRRNMEYMNENDDKKQPSLFNSDYQSQQH